MQHFSGQYYHIFNRGVNHQPIFVREDNYRFLLRRIKLFLPDYSLTFIAYCLMPNHYHMLIRVNVANTLSPFIQRLFSSYTQAYNKQQGRSGTLFEGRPKCKLVAEDAYVLQLSRYIHLNPVKAGLVDHPAGWPYSNYQEWVNLRPGKLFDLSFVRGYFPKPADYEDFVTTNVTEEQESRLKKYYLE
jgi:putative transposase